MATRKPSMVRKTKYSRRTDTLERLIWVGIGLEQVRGVCLKECDLTRLQAEILLALAYEPDPTITLALTRPPTKPSWTAKRLATQLKCSEPTVSNELRHLEERLLIIRNKGVDRRSNTITATESGNALARTYSARIGAESERIFRGMAVGWHTALDKLEKKIPGTARRRVRRVPVT